MGFTQVDENTVQDEDGNTYYAPYLAKQAVDGQFPGLAGAPSANPGSAPDELPSLDTLKQVPDGPSVVNPEQSTPSPAPGRDYVVPAPGEKPPLQAGVAAAPMSAQQAKNAAETNDVAAFSAAGGVANTDEDMARMAGGHAAHEAETAKANVAANTIAAQGNIEKNKTMAGLILKTADDYEQHAAKIQADSKARYDDWKKRSDQAAATLLDPNHAMSSMSTMSKASWILRFIGAGLQGGGAVDSAASALNKLVEQDMSAQKYNIENKRTGLNEEKSYLAEQDRSDKDALGNWYAAKNLRMTAIGKQLDSQIQQMGLPAAQAAGLLSARDMIEKEVLKNQQHVADHYFTQGQTKSAQAHDVYMERLKSNLRMTEDAYKETLKNGEKRDTLPTGTGLGLQMVDKNSGKAVVNGQIPLRKGITGELAVKAGEIFTGANQEASQLKDIQDSLGSMSATDLVRGGTPAFKSMVKQVANDRAVAENGKRVTDEDVKRAYQEIFGADIGGKIFAGGMEALKGVGPYKEGIQKSIDQEMRNLSTKTTNRLLPYLDPEAAQQYEVKFNPQYTHVSKTSDTPDDLNTALTKASGGADINDLKVPGARPPVTKDVVNLVIKDGHATEVVDPDELAQFKSEKSKGRGLQGGLPRIDDAEEQKIERITSSFTHAPADDILRLAQSYLRGTSLSEEGKHEVRLAAQEAIKESTDIENKVTDEAMRRFKADQPTSGLRFGGTQKRPYDDSGNYSEDFKKYLDSDMVNEMRRRAGLEARTR